MNQVMQRELNTFPLPQHVRFKLHSNGFTTVEDLENIGPEELANETQLTQEEAAETLQLIFHQHSSEANPVLLIDAKDLFERERSKPLIPTFCHELDSVLGGGISLRILTELCGEPGCGKTQMCMQLCSNVQIPECCGGLDGEAIFLDTEGSFTIERFSQIVDATAETCQKIIRSVNSSLSVVPFSSNTILDRLHYFRCMNYQDLIAQLTLLPEFLTNHPKVRLLVIDSISFHFRYGFDENYVTRAGILTGIGQSLAKIANEFELAVILTNQMTTRIQDDENNYSVVPALGVSWGHVCAVNLKLTYDQEKRQATLIKSCWRKRGTANFKITAGGIRDCQSLLTKTEEISEPRAQESHFSKENPVDQGQPTKKLKICG